MLCSLLWTLSVTWTALLFPGTAVKVVPPCDRSTFHLAVHDCTADFNRSMEMSGYREACPWPDIKPLYNELGLCVTASVERSWCMGYTAVVDEVFVTVHRTYFFLCGRLGDPPLHVLLLLVAPAVVVTLFLPFLCVHLTTD